jgi:2-iminobutanoate/2-iminopropanoate deaminase
MLRAIIIGAIALLALAAVQSSAQMSGQGFEKKNFNHNPWTKGHFSEVVTVTGPGTLIYMAGVGDHDDNTGAIVHQGDFLAQCRDSYGTIKKLLALHNATMSDIVKLTVYVTDIRYQADYGKCRAEAFAEAPIPTHTFIVISQLATAGMIVEVDATAIVAR